MNQFAACAAVMLAVGLVSAEEPKNEWVKIAPEKEQYELLFPSKPMEKRDKEGAQYVLEREGGEAALLLQINFFTKEADIAKPELMKSIMDNGRDTLVKFHKGSETLSEKESKFNKKYPERDIDLDIPEIGLYRTRFILTPTSFYQMTVLGPKDYVNGAEAKRFLDSFKLGAEESKKVEWVKIAPEKEGYEILFPAKPKETKNKERTQYVLERERGEAVLLLQVNFFSNEVEIANRELATSIMDKGRDALVKFYKGSKTLSEKESKFNKKYPARDIDFDVPAIGLYRTRFIVTPTSFFQITVTGPKDYVDGPEAKKFIESFNLSEDEPKKEWVKIAPDKEKHEFQFPAKPKETIDKDSAQYLLVREGGKALLLIHVETFSREGDPSNTETVKRIFDAARNSLRESCKGSKILSEKESLLCKKYPTRDIDFEVPGPKIDRTRFILTKTAFYQVIVRGPKCVGSA